MPQETAKEKAERAKAEGNKDLAEAYLNIGMTQEEYEEAKVSGGAGFPVEGIWVLMFGVPFAAQVGSDPVYDVVQFPYSVPDGHGTPFVGYEGEWTVFPGVNPNTGKSQMKTTLQAAGVAPDKKGNFKPADIEGKLVRGYFKIPVDRETKRPQEYYDIATDEMKETTICKLITVLPMETTPESEKELPF